MNLEQLRGFVEVASTGHFTQAAERLHLAQPSLSRQVITLERELGVDLFHRARGNITLTVAGERLLPIARRMLSDAETARAEMADLAGLRGGRVRLGATPTLCTSLVADVLADFHHRHPGVEIEVMERGSRRLIAALMEGELDLALIVTSMTSGARAVIEREPILSERLVVVSSIERDDPFEGAETVSVAQLARVPQVMFPDTYDLRVGMDAVFRDAGVTPHVAVEGAEMDAAIRFVKRGIGVAVVPAMVATVRSGLRATPLAELTRTVSIARRSDMAPTHAGAQLQAEIRAASDRLTSPGASLATLVSRVSPLEDHDPR